MPTERTLTLPLSGEEIVTAITEKLGTSLRRDCFLTPNTAYEYFEAKITIAIKCHDVGDDRMVNQEVAVSVGEPPSDPEEVTEIEGEVEIAPAPPNEVRIETGQPVPVLTKEDDRPVIKHVKYSKKKHGKVQ